MASSDLIDDENRGERSMSRRRDDRRHAHQGIVRRICSRCPAEHVDDVSERSPHTRAEKK